MEYPLTHSWSLWHDTNWEDLKELISFDSIGTFWQVFNNIPAVNDLCHMTNFRLFRQGIHPSREAPEHKEGGQWTIQFWKSASVSDIWLHLVLDIIGSTIPEEHTITGLELNIRTRGHRISIWTNTSVNQNLVGEHLLQSSDDRVSAIHFKEHHTILEKKSAFSVKPLIQVKYAK